MHESEHGSSAESLQVNNKKKGERNNLPLSQAEDLDEMLVEQITGFSQRWNTVVMGDFSLAPQQFPFNFLTASMTYITVYASLPPPTFSPLHQLLVSWIRALDKLVLAPSSLCFASFLQTERDDRLKVNQVSLIAK